MLLPSLRFETRLVAAQCKMGCMFSPESARSIRALRLVTAQPRSTTRVLAYVPERTLCAVRFRATKVLSQLRSGFHPLFNPSGNCRSTPRAGSKKAKEANPQFPTENARGCRGLGAPGRAARQGAGAAKATPSNPEKRGRQTCERRGARFESEFTLWTMVSSDKSLSCRPEK